MKEKVCTNCQQLLSFDKFYNQNSNVDGKRGKCKKCYLEEARYKRMGKKIESKKLYDNKPELRELRKEVKILTSKDSERLEKIINRLASLKLYQGYQKEYDLLIDMCYYKIDKSLGAGNKY